jgi:Helix-turn-helix domain
VQTWALSLRAQGKSVLFIHHSGKGGSQRGSSKKEDVLDTVISLKRPEDYTQEKGSCFIVSFEKARGFHGNDAIPFEASLIVNDKNQSRWATRTLEESTYEKVIGMLNDGMNQAEIASELDIHKSTVSRHASRARTEGLLKK